MGINKLFFCFFCAVGYLLFIQSAFSLPSDHNQPLHISANSGHFDRKKGMNILTGQVVVVQGTSTLQADRLTLYTNNKNQLFKAVAEGNPAHYTTEISEKRGNFVATAQQIEYLPPQNILILLGNAKATQGPNSYAAPKIEYQINQETVISPSSDHGRTTIVIQPQSLKENAPRA